MDNAISKHLPGISDTSVEKAKQLQRAATNGSALTEKQLKQIKKTAQDFEGLFISMMLKSMRETVEPDSLTGGGRGEEIYRSMLDEQYVAQTVKRGGFGLAKQIEKDIIRQESKKIARTVDKKG